jgi:hypothetical protein
LLLASRFTPYFDPKPIEAFVKAYPAMVLSHKGQAIIARLADREKGLLRLSHDGLGGIARN